MNINLKSERIELSTIDDFFRLSNKWGDSKALRQILFLMEAEGCKLAYTTQVDDNDDYILDCTLLGDKEAHLIRCDFFKNDTISENNFLGYLEIRPNNKEYPIYGAFIKIPESNLHKLSYFITCIEGYEYSPIYSSEKLKLKGTFFSQRDGKIGQCAHASLRMVSYYNKKLIAIHKIKKMISENGPSIGLDPGQTEQVLKGLGYYPKIYYFNEPEMHSKNESGGKQKKKLDAQSPEEIIYMYLESQIPVLVDFGTKRCKSNQALDHTVLILGHTFDSYTWWPLVQKRYYKKLPYGGYLKSSSWINFIGHDDNFGAYLTIPKDYLKIKRVYIPLSYQLKIFAEMVNPLVIAALKRERIKEILTATNSIWSNSFLRHLKEKSLLLRTFLIDKNSFIEKINQTNISGKMKEFYNNPMLFNPPDNFWLTEISIPEIFAHQRHCLGIVITNPNPNFNVTSRNIYKKSDELIKYYHLPGNIIIPKGIGREWCIKINDDVPYTHIMHSAFPV